MQLSRESYCRSVLEVEELRTQRDEKERVWIVDGQGNVFTEEDLKRGRVSYRSTQKTQPTDMQEESIPGADDTDEKERTSAEAGIDKEMLVYLEHIARYLFMPALQRDESLNLSRYKGGVLRQRLTEMAWVKTHKVNTGRRSGQVTLLEVTEVGYEFLASMKIRIGRPRGRGGFVRRYYAHKLKQYAEATWPGCVANIEDDSLGRPADVTVKTLDGRNVAFEVFITGESKEVRGIVQDARLFDEVIVCAPDSGSLENLKARVASVLNADALKKVTFHLISAYILAEAESTAKSIVESQRQKRQHKPQPQSSPKSSKFDDQLLFPTSETEKSRPNQK